MVKQTTDHNTPMIQSNETLHSKDSGNKDLNEKDLDAINAHDDHVQETRWIGGMMQAGMQAAVEAIQPIVTLANLELLGLERTKEGRRPTLWVYLDHPNGVTLDQCAEITAEISAALDVIDPISDAYDLRISSPGVERPLLCGRHFQRFQGSQVQLKLMTPIQGRRKFRGKIVSMQEHLMIECSDGEHQIPLSFINRAHLYYDENDYRDLLRAHGIK